MKTDKNTPKFPANHHSHGLITCADVFCKLAVLAEVWRCFPINQEPGAWMVDLDDHWRIAVNAHRVIITVPKDEVCMAAGISPYTCAVWFNGFMAALFGPEDSTFAQGEEANPAAFLAAIDKKINLAKQPQPPGAPQPWRYVGS